MTHNKLMQVKNLVKLLSSKSLDATSLLQNNLNPDYFKINVSNQLSPVFELKGLQLDKVYELMQQQNY